MIEGKRRKKTCLSFTSISEKKRKRKGKKKGEGAKRCWRLVATVFPGQNGE